MADFFLKLNLVHSVLKIRLQYWIHTRVKKKNCVYVCWSDRFFQSLLNRFLKKNATVAACILLSFGDGVLVYIIYMKIS